MAIAWAGWPSSKNPPFCHKEMKKNVLGLAQITAVQRRAVLPAVSREGGSVAAVAVAIAAAIAAAAPQRFSTGLKSGTRCRPCLE